MSSLKGPKGKTTKNKKHHGDMVLVFHKRKPCRVPLGAMPHQGVPFLLFQHIFDPKAGDSRNTLYFFRYGCDEYPKPILV